MISILRASREPALVPVDRGLGGLFAVGAHRRRFSTNRESKEGVKGRQIETLARGNLAKSRLETLHQGCHRRTGGRPVACSARARIEKIAELTEVPSTSRDTLYELDGLAKPPKRDHRGAKDARKSRQTRRQNASTKIPQRERLAAAAKASAL